MTYMLSGRMRHGDNKGNEDLLESGGVQWMTAGRLHRPHHGHVGISGKILSEKTLEEPVVQHGPFVMNTKEEVLHALADFRDGRS